jgi:uncharacterized protein
LTDVASALREGFFMFWETLWALVLGFGLSGAVQAFASREDMERLLGDHRPATVARAAGFGMASSSCSYAAAAMAKSLFAKGADLVSAMVFMFASTNLVIDLGVVLVVLMGWQFAAAEVVGGSIMIVLLVVLGGVVLRGPLVDRARRRLAPAAAATDRPAGGTPLRVRLRSRAGWTDAATYAIADLTMLRRELVIGYGVAGALAALVPVRVWNDLFLAGHGWWTSAENALVGPLIAVVSFVCSIGNVPMAAALWHGGIRFGGVISFVFADLIALPLLLVYRKFYGDRLTARLFLTFYAVMAAAGLIVEGLFSALGAVPHRRPRVIVATHFRWNATTGLNIVFLAVFAVLWWLHRQRDGGGSAVDPVCCKAGQDGAFSRPDASPGDASGLENASGSGLRG